MKSQKPNQGKAGTAALVPEEAQTRWGDDSLRADRQSVGAEGLDWVPLGAEAMLSPAMYT